VEGGNECRFALLQSERTHRGRGDSALRRTADVSRPDAERRDASAFRRPAVWALDLLSRRRLPKRFQRAATPISTKETKRQAAGHLSQRPPDVARAASYRPPNYYRRRLSPALDAHRRIEGQLRLGGAKTVAARKVAIISASIAGLTGRATAQTGPTNNARLSTRGHPGWW
jgi:hypothetical protein